MYKEFLAIPTNQRQITFKIRNPGISNKKEDTESTKNISKLRKNLYLRLLSICENYIILDNFDKPITN